MRDNALVIIIAFYCVSGTLLAVQLVLADALGIIMTTPSGEPMKPHLLTFIDQELVNRATTNIINGTDGTFDRVESGPTSGWFVAWEIIQLMTGLYAFNLLILFGIPFEIVVVFAAGYLFVFARGIIGMVTRT